MSLSPGIRLGPYEIQGAIGAGGMGEVYRARDTRLDRTIAIKVLPADIAADPAARARFEREARAVAALNHPHICTLHDIGRHAVADGSAIDFLVLEHLEGQTLAARLEKGPLPLDQVLTLGAEIADALDKAHREGIVHRDLKPANVMLTKAGTKLLDFGLAKLKAPATPVSMSGMAGATTNPGTAQGTILGTVLYMAPEQVEGREADPRSDIWALGAVLYEMATGTRPFTGETPASVIGAILKDTPASITTRRPLVPRALDDIIRRCLAKDPDERWQSSADVGWQLQLIASNETASDERHGRPSGAWRERLAWIVATALLLAVLAFVTLWRRPVAPDEGVIRLSVNPPDQTVFTAHPVATVPTPQFSMSPDGRSIVFVAAAPALRPTLWLRSLDEVDAHVLPETDGAQEPFWSPDSRWIGFFDAEGRMRKVPVSGGPVQTIADGIWDPRTAWWGVDDTILFGTGFGPVYRVAAAGGTLQPVTELDSSRQEGSHRFPQFLPDGRHFLFTVRSGLAEQRGVYVGDLKERSRRRLVASDANARYAPPGYLLFLSDDTLVGQPFDLERLELTGQPMPIAARVGRGSRGDGAFSASSTGMLAYSSPRLRPGRLTWFDRNGSPLEVVGPDGEQDFTDFRLSPDDSRLAASLVDPNVSVPNIWLSDLVRGGTSPFAVGPALNAAAIWSPDGRRIAFRTTRNGMVEFNLKAAGASGKDEPLLLQPRTTDLASSNVIPTDWSPDGQHIVFSGGSTSDLWLLPHADGKPISLVRYPSDQMHANFSRDGRYIAYTSNESGRFDVYAETNPPSDRRWPVSTNGGYEPRWRADGREIYYLSEDRTLMAVPVSSGPAPFGVPRPLFQTQVHAEVSALRTHYVPNRDGTRFLVHTRSRELSPVPITVVSNWTAVLKR
jgi:serine/threonine protein kinase/Tol biopolymer transport system component